MEMINARPPAPRSPLLLRSRSGASALPRRSTTSSPRPIPLFSSLSNSAPAALARSNSSAGAAKKRQAAPAEGAPTKPAAPPLPLLKENLKSAPAALPPPDPAAGPRKPRPIPSAWALSPGRSPPRSPSPGPAAQLDAGASKTKGALSSSMRSLARATPSQNPPGSAPVAAASGGKKSDGGGVLGLFRRMKEAAPGEEESHQLRLLSSRLVQWRFANARAEAAVEASQCNAEEMFFHVWLRTYELRNLVAAKRILTERRKQKVKVARLLRPQLHLLAQWEPHAKKHLEAVATLIRLLGAACLSLPLVEGAQADLASVHRGIADLTEITGEIAGAAGGFFPQAGDADAVLCQLIKTIRLEMDGLEELIKMCRVVTALETHEVSLRAHMIQAMKEEDERIICCLPPRRRLPICKDAFAAGPARVVPYRTLVGTIY